MRNRNFQPRFNLISSIVFITHLMIILIKVSIFALILYVIYLLFTSDIDLNTVGNAIGSFIASIQNGMNGEY